MVVAGAIHRWLGWLRRRRVAFFGCCERGRSADGSAQRTRARASQVTTSCAAVLMLKKGVESMPTTANKEM